MLRSSTRIKGTHTEPNCIGGNSILSISTARHVPWIFKKLEESWNWKDLVDGSKEVRSLTNFRLRRLCSGSFSGRGTGQWLWSGGVHGPSFRRPGPARRKNFSTRARPGPSQKTENPTRPGPPDRVWPGRAGSNPARAHRCCGVGKSCAVKIMQLRTYWCLFGSRHMHACYATYYCKCNLLFKVEVTTTKWRLW